MITLAIRRRLNEPATEGRVIGSGERVAQIVPIARD